MSGRKPFFSFRTTKMSDEMYDHVLKKIKQTKSETFLEYAFKLIEEDMKDDNNYNALSPEIVNEIRAVKDEMDKRFNQLNDKLDKNTLVYSEGEKFEFSQLTQNEVEEGEIIPDQEVTGTIEEDIDVDF